MNAMVHRIIAGQSVYARPVYKGGSLPAYWTAIINGHTLPKTFDSVDALFRFASSQAYRH
ncbi:hypothetical protein QVG61_01695 [Thiohalobacter sp. IOR34]|uniref:hypothetical protein n=1 Tax=Thiohalobacter sp. IOR34 TaxID=3057176 RepID=UPI0025B016B3|nr:hypothetical protein [Thiohalobacter sp. IOR34]WJW75827.1 hypothetical protein QVG61_01695 [Thiohalobacter sp. IOR34]